MAVAVARKSTKAPSFPPSPAEAVESPFLRRDMRPYTRPVGRCGPISEVIDRSGLASYSGEEARKSAMNRSRWALGGAGVAAVAVAMAGPMPLAVAHGGEGSSVHRVVTEGLDNPRQITWTSDGGSLVVAEAGRGGDQCSEVGCMGKTGALTLIDEPHSGSPGIATQVEGFVSSAAPDGSFAIGSNGADSLQSVEEGFIVAGTPLGGQPPVDGALLVAFPAAPDEGFPDSEIIAFANLQAAEEEQNPDGAQIESNPYAALFVDPTPKGDPGVDGYALVADAAANTVWKVEPDLSYQPPAEFNCFEDAATPPGYECFSVEITVFATYPTTANPDGSDDLDGPPEFVPTSLATDAHGNVYVGGLGSEIAGAASVVKYDSDGDEEARWGGFTAITGIAVDHKSLFVSQLFGSEAPLPEGETPQDEAPTTGTVPGQVVKLNESGEHGKRWAIDVPLPAGLASDGSHVYASVNSIAPAEGVADGPFGPVGGGAVWELDFSDAYEVEPVNASE